MFSKKIIPLQKTYNTLYNQKLFENDEEYGINTNSPPSEYLTRVISNVIYSMCDFQKKSCIIDGVYLFINDYDNETLYCTLSKGFFILNGNFIEQKEDFSFNVDISQISSPYINQIFFVMRMCSDGKNYEICWWFLEEDNAIQNGISWEDYYLPIQIISFKKYMEIISLSVNDPDEFDTPYLYNLSDNFELDSSNILKLNNIYNITYSMMNIIYNTKSLIPSYVKPRILNINGQEYNFPMYTHFENKIYDIIKEWIKMFEYKYNDINMLYTHEVNNIINWNTIFNKRDLKYINIT